MTKEITNKDNRQWFKDAKFGMMIHFCLYSLLAGEWKGKRTDVIAEWAQSCFGVFCGAIFGYFLWFIYKCL